MISLIIYSIILTHSDVVIVLYHVSITWAQRQATQHTKAAGAGWMLLLLLFLLVLGDLVFPRSKRTRDVRVHA